MIIDTHDDKQDLDSSQQGLCLNLDTFGAATIKKDVAATKDEVGGVRDGNVGQVALRCPYAWSVYCCSTSAWHS